MTLLLSLLLSLLLAQTPCATIQDRDAYFTCLQAALDRNTMSYWVGADQARVIEREYVKYLRCKKRRFRLRRRCG